MEEAPPMPDAPTESTRDTGTIVVRGTGRVDARPDLADLRLGVAVSRPTVAAARSEAAATMEAILRAVAELGIEKPDIRTTLLSVQPRYDYRDGQAPRLTGYELANVVEITVRDLERVGDVVDGALGAGATSMDGLSFRVADPAPIEREARIRAMGAARASADVLAEAAGLSIVDVADVVEGDDPRPPTPRYKAERMALAAADVGTPVESGSMEIAVTVTVTYRAR
jgi:uncharacterized protein YggE